MVRADDIAQIAPGVFYWSAYARDMKADLSSSALIHDDRIYFFDPIGLTAKALEELSAHGSPAAILLTSQTHGRAAANYQKRLKIPVFAHRLAVDDLKEEVKVDQVFDGGECLFDFLEAIHIPGSKPGETAFCDQTRGVCVIGDALVNLPGYEFTFLPDKYSDDPAASRESLRKLLGRDIHIMLFAHGEPLIQNVGGKLLRLLGC
nr:MBL fold metallo-hydrolase [Oscillatoria laete-virens]